MIFSTLNKIAPLILLKGGEAVLAELKKLQLGQRILSTLDHIFKLIFSQSATFPVGWLDWFFPFSNSTKFLAESYNLEQFWFLAFWTKITPLLPRRGGVWSRRLTKLQLGQRMLSNLDHRFKLNSSQIATFPGGGVGGWVGEIKIKANLSRSWSWSLTEPGNNFVVF